MNGFRISPLLFLISIVFLCENSFANRGFTNHPPAYNPSFRLIESTTSQVIFAFEPSLDDMNLSSRVSENVYFGIPPSTIHELDLLEWKFRIIDSNDTIDVIQGNVESATQNVRDIEKQINAGIETDRYQYQELDIVSIDFTFPQNAAVSSSTQTYQRHKVVADKLIYKLSWKDRGISNPSPQTRTDTGFANLYKNLVFNATTALSMRGKRRLPEPEKEQGFHAYASGYLKDASLVNKTDETLEHRQDAVRVLVRKNGVVAVRPADFIREGVDPKLVKLDWIQVWHKGVEVTSSVYDHNFDTVFNEGDAVYFYGQASDSPFTKDNSYYLTWGVISSPPKRAEQLSPESLHVDEPLHTATLLVDDDHILGMESVNQARWFYAQLDEQSNSFPVTLPGLMDTGEVEIKISWMNKNKTTTGIMLNVGNATRSFFFDANEDAETVFRVPAYEYIASPTVHVLMHQKPPGYSVEEGSTKKSVIPRLFIDTLEFRYPKKSDPGQSPLILYSDSLATVQLKSSTDTLVTTWMVYENELSEFIRFESPVDEITLPNSPRDTLEIYPTGKEPGPHTIDMDYPSTLHRTDQGYDYVIIAYRSLVEEAKRLAEIREQDGFSVLLCDVQDIYDEFNYGYPDYDAIKRFLRYAQSEWTGLSPEFITLIGESNWDHRDNEGRFIIDQIPTYTPIDDPQNYASDEWYAYLWSEEDNIFSDVMIGRISVSNPTDLKNYIDKIITYETESPVGLWKGRNLFISDDNFWMHSYTSAETSITEKLSPSFVNQFDFPHETSPYLYERFHNHPNEEIRRKYTNLKISSEATLAVLDALNESALITQYYGHGGAQLWSHERLFYGTDRETSNVLELKPTNRFPFILNWSCLTGYLNINIPPFNVCLAEEFVRYSDRGAIAVWAPSENGHTDQHELMSHYVVRSLIQDGLSLFGEAINFTKALYLLTRNSANDYKLMKQYILFGDPGIELALPKENLLITNTTELLFPEQENEISLRVQSEHVLNGKGVVSFSFEGKNIYESGVLPVVDGVIEHSWMQEIPETKSEDVIVRVYLWDEVNNIDAWGGVRIPVINPVISLGEGSAVLEHNPHVISLDVNNRSDFNIEGLECTFYVGDQNETVPVGVIEAKSSTRVEWKGLLPVDIHFVYAEVNNPSGVALQFENRINKIAVTIPREQGNDISPLLGLMTYSPDEAVKDNLTRIQIPFRNLSHDTTLYATTTLEGPGSATTPKLLSLNSQQERQLVYTITPVETGIQDYKLTVITDTQQDEFIIPIDVKEKPDLALAEGDVIVSPENPIIGKTVTFKTNVYNMGESTARNITITAYDGDPENNKKLTSFRSTRSETIAEIAPGEVKEVDILWDPEAYEGVGIHEIHFVIDPFNRIEELSEENNTSTYSLTLHDLPDLFVNPWYDHRIKINTANNRIPVWGEPIQLSARVRNLGDSAAEYVRMTFFHNQKEITTFIPRIPATVSSETQVEVPLLSAKNTLMIYTDKYNLVGEKNEVSEENNNETKEQRLDVQLQMPEAKIVDNRRYYEITAETQFAAGTAEHIVYDQRNKGISMPIESNWSQLHLSPAFVENTENFDMQTPMQLWEWSIKYNVFSSPVQSDAELRFRVPAINGSFDVYAQLYSNNPDKSATDSIRFKVAGEVDYQLFEYHWNEDPKAFHKLGTYTITDDSFVIEFKAVPGGYSTNIGDLKFIHNPDDTQPVSMGYLSPYFPASGVNGTAELSWDADIPEGTELTLKARWAVKNPDGKLRFLPWSRTVSANETGLNAVGKGDYLQYYAEFKKPVTISLSPVLKRVSVSIPCKN